MVTIALIAPTAEAFECLTYCGCDWADGSQLTYHVNVNDFSSAEIDQIVIGANAWDAGAGKIVRGADWDFIRGSDQTSDGTPGNSTNEVYMRNDTFFGAYGMSGAVGITIRSHLFCGRRDTDVVFNEDESFTTAVPSDAGGSVYSIGFVAMHEFGHVLGLDHNDGSTSGVSVMLPEGTGSDMSKKLRINEDDYLGLIEDKSDTSTGKNLMLQKFRRWADGPLETWDATLADWDACPGGHINGDDGPEAIGAIIVGTSASQSPLVRWWLSADTDCANGTKYVVGSRTPTISVNEPYMIVPSSGYDVPSNTPPGDYTLCAAIDPDDAISETSDVDNDVQSSVPFTVLSCP